MSRADNKLVVLTRSNAGNCAWAPHIRVAGFQVYGLATIQTVPLPLSPDVKETLKSLTNFDWVVLTSATSVKRLHELAVESDITWPPDGPQAAVVGTNTGHAAESVGLHVDYISTKPDAETLGTGLPTVRNQRILIPKTTIASDVLEKTLANRGAQVVSLPVYETQIIDKPDKMFLSILKSERVRTVVFASPSAIRGFCKQLPEAQLTKARQLPAVAIGPGVEVALEKQGFINIHTCRSPSVESVIAILRQLDR